MKLTKEQIREIAENLDMGMRCFYQLKTDEIEATPDFFEGDWIVQDTEPWQETLDKLDEPSHDKFFDTHGDDY